MRPHDQTEVRKHINIDSDQAHCSCGNTLNFYLGGAQFKSQP